MIRPGNVDDVPAIHGLICELALYEKAPQEVTLSKEQLALDGFGQNPKYTVLVAEDEGNVVGAAICYEKYSTWKGSCLFLEDLIVTESHRGKGFGKALLDEVIRMARQMDAGRLEWQVLDWNEPAIKFYRAIGARLDEEWINCKLDHAQLTNYE